MFPTPKSTCKGRLTELKKKFIRRNKNQESFICMVFSCLCFYHSQKNQFPWETYFICTNIISLLHLKWSSGRLVITAKGLLKLINLFILKNSLSLSRTLAHKTFGKLLIVFSTKTNLLYFLYLIALRYCLQHLIKQHSLLKTFLINLILMTHVSLYHKNYNKHTGPLFSL